MEWSGMSISCFTAYSDASLSLPVLFVLSCVAYVRGSVWLGLNSGAIYIYHPQTYALLQSLAHAHRAAVTSIVHSPFNGYVFTGGCDFLVQCWALPDPTPASAGSAGASKSAGNSLVRCRLTYRGHSNAVRCVVVPSAIAVWSGSEDGSIRVWHTATGVCESALLGHSGAVLALLNTGYAVCALFSSCSTRKLTCGLCFCRCGAVERTVPSGVGHCWLRTRCCELSQCPLSAQ
jgi:WD40 repeat protein